MFEDRYVLALVLAMNHATAILEHECGGTKVDWRQFIMTEAFASVDRLSEEEMAAYCKAIKTVIGVNNLEDD